MMPSVVVKVGGSLLDWPELPDRLGKFLASRAPDRLVLIVGGGAVADVIRAWDRTHGLGEERSHHLALRALDLTAHVLADLVPGLDVVETLDQCGPIWARGRLPVLAPRRLLDNDHDLPHHWDVTTDTIAALLAARLGAAELVLLKSALLPPGTDLAGAARLGLVDPEFPRFAAGLERVTFINLRDPGWR
jgi:aspartokinase-like uncharacterized kinase